MTHNYWQRKQTKTLFSHNRLTVVEDEVVLPNGHQTQYMRYEGLQDYVTVIPIRDQKMALIKEYSYPHNEWLWQFPEGGIETSEQPVITATRELHEEASLISENIKQIGMNYSHHRRSTEKNYIFVADSVREVESIPADIEEIGTEVHWFTFDEIGQMVMDGDIVQKNALAALALYFLRNGRERG